MFLRIIGVLGRGRRDRGVRVIGLDAPRLNAAEMDVPVWQHFFSDGFGETFECEFGRVVERVSCECETAAETGDIED